MDIQAVYRNFERQWATHRVDYDHVFNFQCVDLIKQYVHQEFKLKPGSWGDALAYWNSTPPELLDHFEKINTNSPHMGDIVILNICHIGIATGTVFAETFQMLDQNGGATHNGSGIGDDSIQVHTFARSHIMGVLRPKNNAPAPSLPYTITTIPHKQIVLNKQPTKQYGLNHQTFAEVSSNVTATGNLGDIKTVAATLHHKDGYTYYLEDAARPVGWNVLDCNDYTPPAPKAPYVPPAAPNKGASAEQYTLVTSLPYYGSEDDCQNNRNPLGLLPTGTFYVFSKAGGNSIYYNLTSNNMKNLNHWVNILNNVVPKQVVESPAMELTAEVKPIQPSESEIRASYRDIFSSGAPLAVVAKTNLSVADILGRANMLVPIKKGQDFSVYGTFKKNDQWYIMPKLKMSDKSASDFMFGIPINNERTLEPFLEDLYGFPEQLRYGVAVWYDKLVNSLEGIFRAKTKK